MLTLTGYDPLLYTYSPTIKYFHNNSQVISFLDNWLRSELAFYKSIQFKFYKNTDFHVNKYLQFFNSYNYLYFFGEFNNPLLFDYDNPPLFIWKLS